MAFDYRSMDSKRDQVITDQVSGEIIGLRNDQERQVMFNQGASVTKITDGRCVYVPANTQCYNVGGITVTSGSFVCDGEIISAAAQF